MHNTRSNAEQLAQSMLDSLLCQATLKDTSQSQSFDIVKACITLAAKVGRIRAKVSKVGAKVPLGPQLENVAACVATAHNKRDIVI